MTDILSKLLVAKLAGKSPWSILPASPAKPLKGRGNARVFLPYSWQVAAEGDYELDKLFKSCPKAHRERVWTREGRFNGRFVSPEAAEVIKVLLSKEFSKETTTKTTTGGVA